MQGFHSGDCFYTKVRSNHHINHNKTRKSQPSRNKKEQIC